MFADTRETGFVNAITAAGVTYAVTRACTMGHLVECSCDKMTSKGKQGRTCVHFPRKMRSTERPRDSDLANDANFTGNRLDKLTRTVEMEKSLPTEGDWEWGGCGDNVKFGFKKSRDFMDAPYRKRSDIKTLVKLHNNNAGRLVGGHTTVIYPRITAISLSAIILLFSRVCVYVYVCRRPSGTL